MRAFQILCRMITNGARSARGIKSRSAKVKASVNKKKTQVYDYAMSVSQWDMKIGILQTSTFGSGFELSSDIEDQWNRKILKLQFRM
jgi:hypothetical protein